MRFLIFVSVLISGAFIGSVIATPFNQRKPEREIELEPLTTDDFLAGKLYSKPLNAEWVTGNDKLMRIQEGDSVLLYNVENGESQTILNLTRIMQQLPAGSSFQRLIYSNDGAYALVQHQNPEFFPVWPTNSSAKFDILDVQSGNLISKLNPSGWDDSESQADLQAVQWSPSGRSIAFIYDFNIYYHPNVTSPSEEVRQITEDGQDNKNLAIYNGIPDWSYNGAGLMGDAMWFSESGGSLAYIKFNETSVSQSQWAMYGKPGDEKGIYPTWNKIRYAKTGTPNARITLRVAEFAEDGISFPKTLDLSLIQKVDEDPYIIGKVLMLNEDKIVVAALPRNQTSLLWLLCEGDKGCDEIHRIEQKNGWVDGWNTAPIPSKTGGNFLFYESIFQNEEIGSYMHIVKVDVSSGTRTVITEGKLYVDRVLGWDETRNKIYFQGTFWNGTVADPSEMQVYSVSDSGVNRDLTCLTCELSNAVGKKCRKNTAQFSADFTYFIHSCGGPGTPMTTTRMTSGSRQVDNPGPSLVINSDLQAFLDTKALPVIKEYLVPVGNGNESLGFNARARLHIPPNAVEGETYPLILHVYGGPYPIFVDQSYFYEYFWGWLSTLPSGSKGILAFIDGRGTPMQSSEYQFQTYRKFGTVEIDDQIQVTKWLTENEPLIDKDNVAVTGVSYGGYSTIRILERDSDQVFKCGISQAPVTNWRYYFTGYTERYMGLPTPEDNLQGYMDGDANSPEAVGNLRNKTLLLIHGTADYNVHFQNSMLFTRALQQADIMFHEMHYPDEEHSFMKPETQRHMIHTMENFLFKECYKK